MGDSNNKLDADLALIVNKSEKKTIGNGAAAGENGTLLEIREKVKESLGKPLLDLSEPLLETVEVSNAKGNTDNHGMVNLTGQKTFFGFEISEESPKENKRKGIDTNGMSERNALTIVAVLMEDPKDPITNRAW